MKHYLFVIRNEDGEVQTGISNDTLFDDYDLAFDCLKNWALHEFQVEDIQQPSRNIRYSINIKGTLLQIWPQDIPSPEETICHEH